MEKLKFDDIVKKLQRALELNEEAEDYEYGTIQLFDSIYKFDEKTCNSLGVGKIERMENGSRGGRDEGSYYERVYYFADHDVYMKIEGYYTSYEGTTFEDGWNCVTEVRPQQETITVYK